MLRLEYASDQELQRLLDNNFSGKGKPHFRSAEDFVLQTCPPEFLGNAVDRYCPRIIELAAEARKDWIDEIHRKMIDLDYAKRITDAGWEL